MTALHKVHKYVCQVTYIAIMLIKYVQGWNVLKDRDSHRGPSVHEDRDFHIEAQMYVHKDGDPHIEAQLYIKMGTLT